MHCESGADKSGIERDVGMEMTISEQHLVRISSIDKGRIDVLLGKQFGLNFNIIG
jgi:hypothetical protein